MSKNPYSKSTFDKKRRKASFYKYVFINMFLYKDFVSAHWATYMHGDSNERVITFIQ